MSEEQKKLDDCQAELQVIPLDHEEKDRIHHLNTDVLISIARSTNSIAESLKVIANPMMVVETRTCKNCGTHAAPDVKWFSPGFCSKKCVMELGTKLIEEEERKKEFTMNRKLHDKQTFMGDFNEN